MPDPRFMQAVVVGWQPDGEAVLMRFRYEDQSEMDVWVRTRDLPQFLLHVQAGYDRASAVIANNEGSARSLRVWKIAKLSAGHTDDHLPFIEVAFESGLKVNMEMGDSTATAFVGALDHLKQNKPDVTKH
jgi:hypothetical protein